MHRARISPGRRLRGEADGGRDGMFRYSLATLVMVLVVAAIVFAFTRPLLRESWGVHALEAGGCVAWSRRVGFTGVGGVDALLPWLDGLPEVRELDFEYSDLSAEGVRRVARLKQVKVISLEGVDLGDADLLPLTNLPNLRELDLRWTRVTSEGARRLLEGIPSLKTLILVPAMREGCDSLPDSLRAKLYFSAFSMLNSMGEPRQPRDPSRPFHQRGLLFPPGQGPRAGEVDPDKPRSILGW